MKVSADYIKSAFRRNQKINHAQALKSTSQTPGENSAEDLLNAAEINEIDVENILKNSQLIREHVEGALRYCVAIRPYLQARVGVFPVIAPADIFERAAESVHSQLISSLPRRSPLIEVGQCKGNKKLLEERNKEEKRRNEEDKKLNAQSRELLKKQFKDKEIVRLFLEAMSDEVDFLGNAYNKMLSFEECDQFIIPMRVGAHYNVAVVHCDKRHKKANITFYDSFGGAIQEANRKGIEDFFQNKGYKASFQDISKREQQDAYNCGIFAALKGIEIASLNVGQKEDLFQNISRDYERTFTHFRCLFFYALEGLGYNLRLDDSLPKSLAEAIPLPEFNEDRRIFAQKLETWRLEAEQMLNELLNKLDKTKQDQVLVHALINAISAFDAAKEEAKKDNTPQETQREIQTQSFKSRLMSWLLAGLPISLLVVSGGLSFVFGMEFFLINYARTLLMLGVGSGAGLAGFNFYRNKSEQTVNLSPGTPVFTPLARATLSEKEAPESANAVLERERSFRTLPNI